MEGYLTDFLNSTSDAAKATFGFVAQVAKEAKETAAHDAGKAKAYAASRIGTARCKVRQKAVNAKQALERRMFPQPAGATIEQCGKKRKAERVAERKAKLAGSKERLATMPPGKQRDGLAHAAERFERNNVAVERARLADDTYNVGQGEPPEGWERVSADELKKLGMNQGMFPQLNPKFNASEYKDGYYPELYKTKPDVFGEVRYVLSFRGTQGVKDGVTDLVQAFGGETDHYTRAIKAAQKLKRVLGDKLEITGHSMGGGMATAAGIITGTKVYAIDPAGLHPATLERIDQNRKLASAKEYVQNYVAEGEILDSVQAPGSQRVMLAGITSLTPTGGCAMAVAGYRAMMENGTITFAAAGPVHKLPILINAEDVLGGNTGQGLSPGLGGRLHNRLNPIRKVHLHDPKYVIAGLEQQKADDIAVIDRSLGP